jgi:hypothetical protein
MSDQPSTTLSLLQDLEAIQKSLKKITDSAIEIPTLDEIVSESHPKSLNPNNPFLSSSSLSELIRIRNEAEARAAEELANIGKIRSIEEILIQSQQQIMEGEPESEPEPEPEPQGPDPEEIIERLESLFETWVDHSVNQYLKIFESELRNHLQQDFRSLVTSWYLDHDLPIPENFKKRHPEKDEKDAPRKGESDQP